MIEITESDAIESVIEDAFFMFVAMIVVACICAWVAVAIIGLVKNRARKYVAIGAVMGGGFVLLTIALLSLDVFNALNEAFWELDIYAVPIWIPPFWFTYADIAMVIMAVWFIVYVAVSIPLLARLFIKRHTIFAPRATRIIGLTIGHTQIGKDKIS